MPANEQIQYNTHQCQGMYSRNTLFMNLERGGNFADQSGPLVMFTLYKNSEVLHIWL